MMCSIIAHSVEWLVTKSLSRLKMALRLETKQIMKRKMYADFHVKLIPNWVAWSYNTVVVSLFNSFSLRLQL
jgi:hypothetical protein